MQQQNQAEMRNSMRIVKRSWPTSVRTRSNLLNPMHGDNCGHENELPLMPAPPTFDVKRNINDNHETYEAESLGPRVSESRSWKWTIVKYPMQSITKNCTAMVFEYN